MSQEAPIPPLRPADATLEELDELLEEVAQLARVDADPGAFHHEVLGRAVRALAAAGGAIWVRPREGNWRPDARADLSGARVIATLASHPPHAELLDAIAVARRSRLVLPQGAGGASCNPTDFLLLLCPLSLGEGAGAGVLELVQRPGGSPASQQGYLRLLEALCELAADFHRRRRLRTLEALAGASGRAEEFSLAVHRSLDLAPTALAIANEGRGLIECDRLSVAIWQGNRCRVRSVSGVETLDRRANIVRRLEELTDAVVKTGEPFWFSGETTSLAPQIAGPLHAWQDESHARSLAVIPLKRQPAESSAAQEPLGALIAERFGAQSPDEPYRARVAFVARQAELALQNSLDYRGLPFFRILRPIQHAGWFLAVRNLRRTAVAIGLLLATVAALAVIPAELEVEGRGTLQPRARQNVFATSDGIVSELLVEHGSDCRKGDVLARMTRSQLDFDWARVLGETATARKRLASVQASRLDLNPQTAADREKYNQLAAEEDEVQELLHSLERQHGVLEAQREELVLRSPLDGQVITWNVRESLESRPVQRGQVLMQVADLHGPWVLEIEVPDERIGHVLEARGAGRVDLDVSFMLATEPGTVYHGAIDKVALATDVRPPEKADVLVTVRIDAQNVPRLRPGATAVSRIQCGRRALGYVWFHPLWELIQKKVLF